MDIVVKVVLSIIVVLFFRIKERPTKIALYLVGVCCFYDIELPIPMGRCRAILPVAFMISEYRFIGRAFLSLKQYRLLSFLFFMLIIVEIVAICTTKYYNPLNMIVMFCSTYFPIMVGYMSVRNENDLLVITKYLYIVLLLLTFWGVLNLLYHRGVYINMVMTEVNSIGKRIGDMYIDSSRFRIQSMFRNPFNYGICCNILLLYFLYAYVKKIISKKKLVITIVCCLFGILFCESRSVFFTGIVSCLSFLYIRNSASQFLRYGLILSCFFVGAYSFVPFFHEKVDISLSMFDPNSDVKGSSIEMREGQMLSVLRYTSSNELVGNGTGYAAKYLMVGTDEQTDSTLFGLEGIYLSTILERGWIGYLSYVLFYIILYVFIYSKGKIDITTSALACSLLVLSFVMAHMSGPLVSRTISFPILGCMIGLLLNNIKVTI